MAADLMTAKGSRNDREELLTLGDPVKADDLQGRLRRFQQDAVRRSKGPAGLVWTALL